MEKICIKNMGVEHSLKNETATMFFLRKPSLVLATVVLQYLFVYLFEYLLLYFSTIETKKFSAKTDIICRGCTLHVIPKF